MNDTLTIELPSTSSPAEAQAVAAALQQLDAVKGAGQRQARGLDPGSVLVWVKLAAEVATVAGVAIPLLQKLIETIRGQGIKGAKIKLPNGVVIEADQASEAELEKLVKAANTEPGE